MKDKTKEILYGGLHVLGMAAGTTVTAYIAISMLLDDRPMTFRDYCLYQRSRNRKK